MGKSRDEEVRLELAAIRGMVRVLTERSADSASLNNKQAMYVQFPQTPTVSSSVTNNVNLNYTQTSPLYVREAAPVVDVPGAARSQEALFNLAFAAKLS